MGILQVAAILAAAMYILLALIVWSILHRRWRRTPVRLWVAGSVALGLATALAALQGCDCLPPWTHTELACIFFAASTPLRIAALRLDLGWPTLARRMGLLSLLNTAAYLLGLRLGGEGAAVLVGHTSLLLWTMAFAWHAAQSSQRLPSRSGGVLAVVESLLALATLLRLLAMSQGWAPLRNVSEDWSAVLMVCAGLASALYGNLGYLGLVLDRTRAAAQQARDAEVAEKLQRETAAAAANDLRALLQQRERLLQIMAHEIRQPLHSAAGALQAAAQVLATPDAGAADLAQAQAALADLKQRASDRVTRAQAVLGRVNSVLDNTLAAAKLLVRDSPLVLVDTDLELLAQLALGDLTGAQRPQVLMRWHTGIRSAELEPVLVRLALRNLMLNAFAHGGPDVQVWLDVAEQATPPALLLQVSDDGVGVADAVMRHLASTPDVPALPVTEGDHSRRQGLGLFIVRRVMAAHGGELLITPRLPRGVVATLVFPQRY